MSLWISIAVAVLAVAGNVIALSVREVYAGLTAAFLPEALAQDVANLGIVAPTWIVVAVLALRGSLRAYLLWLGVLAFTVYNYVIYAFAVPFGPLFLLWVAVLGLSVYVLIGGLLSVNYEAARACFTSWRAVLILAWLLIVAAAFFALLWLSEDVPALLSGTTPKSLAELALPTNPVHVLDLAFFLPAALATGVMLLRGRSLARVLAPPLVFFLILTGIPILLTPVVQTVRGEPAAWGAVGPIGTLTVLLLGFLVWVLSTVRAPERKAY